MGSNVIVTIIVIVYLLFMLWIGWYSSTKISTNTDFMVAGRRLGPLLMAGTLAATEIGGGSSLGVVQNGMSGFGLSASWLPWRMTSTSAAQPITRMSSAST